MNLKRILTSKYKGVSYNKNHKKWEGSIAEDGVRRSCGFWETDIEAAKALDVMILKLQLKAKTQIYKKQIK